MDKRFEHAKRWIDKAMGDLLNADNNLAAKEVPYDTVFTASRLLKNCSRAFSLRTAANIQ